MVEYRYVAPPGEFLVEREKPGVNGVRNADLAEGFNARGEVIDQSNADKRAIKAYYEGLNKGQR